ncbi:MAG TPA: hypothetical protein VNE40_00300 [Candidatus Dormibacteraeota bacterium]|nr:hypothetical protein [Candidatus Dormibacteraeota bacterium]
MILYHSSPVKNLKTLNTSQTLSNNVNIGNYLFATENKLLALMYLIPKGFPIMTNPRKSNPTVVISGKAEEVLSKDKGGSVYVLDDKNFGETPQKSLTDYEKVSRMSVEPIKEIEVMKTISELIESGVSVYFVDDEVFSSLIRNPKQKALIAQLTKFSQ